MIKKISTFIKDWLVKFRLWLIDTPIIGKAYIAIESKCLVWGFKILLYNYSWLFRFTRFRHLSFKERLAEKNFTVQIRDKQNKAQRSFTFKDSKVSSKVNGGPDSDFVLIWRTVPVGCRVMVDIALGKPRALKKAVICGDLILSGDAMMVKWFLDTNNMMGRLHK